MTDGHARELTEAGSARSRSLGNGTSVGRDRDAELIRRIREFGARLGGHGEEVEAALSQFSVETLVPALRHLARVVRRMGMEPRLSAELRAALAEMRLDHEPAHERWG